MGTSQPATAAVGASPSVCFVMTVISLCLANKTHREPCQEVADGTEAQSSSSLRTTSSAEWSFSAAALQRNPSQCLYTVQSLAMSVFGQHMSYPRIIFQDLPAFSIPLTYTRHSTVLESNSRQRPFFYGRGIDNSKHQTQCRSREIRGVCI